MGKHSKPGTDWDAKKADAGKDANKYTVYGKGKDWGKPETSGGAGEALTDAQLREQGLG